MFDKTFINELLAFAEKELNKEKYIRALRVYIKCYLKGHYKWAKEIDDKYKLDIPPKELRSDLVISMGMALIANKK